MSAVRCEHCGGIIRSPRRNVPVEHAVDVHQASCPGVIRVRSK